MTDIVTPQEAEEEEVAAVQEEAQGRDACLQFETCGSPQEDNSNEKHSRGAVRTSECASEAPESDTMDSTICPTIASAPGSLQGGQCAEPGGRARQGRDRKGWGRWEIHFNF